MLSLFANRVNRVSKGAWDPDKFKIDASPAAAHAAHAGAATPQRYSNNFQTYQDDLPDTYLQTSPTQDVLYSPQLFQALDSIGPELSQFIQPSRQTRENFRQVIKPLETANLAVNPIENLESAYAVKSGPNAPQQLKQEWSNNYCDNAVPSKYLTQQTLGSYELMGLNEAQRRSRPMGEGVPNLGPAVPIDQINSLNFGKGPTSFSTVSHDLYHQNFATLGGPPAVYTGIYTDPLTGVQYDTFESGMPPPDGDWYDISYSANKNRKLDALQGGWSNNTPIPPRKEILEGDWNQAYDRPVNTYGGGGSYADMLRCRSLDSYERSTRFTLNDFTPDNEAPELTGTPANVDGIYGNIKVRFAPRLAGTNRGHDEEDSFRTGPSTDGAHYHNNKLQQNFTKMPQCLPTLDYVGPVNGTQGVYGEQSRSEYNPSNEIRGLEATAEYASHGTGYVDTYGEQSRSDYEVPHKLTGNEVNPELGEHGVAWEYAVQGRSDYNAPTKLWGNIVNDQLAQHGVSNGGAQPVQSRLEYNTPNKQMGLSVNSELLNHGVHTVDAYGEQNRSEYNTPTKHMGMEVNPELGEHGVHNVDTYGEQCRLEYNTPNKLMGTSVNPELMEHGVNGGAYGGQNRKALSRHNRIAFLKFIQGAIKSDTDGQMNRNYPTRFNDRKNTTNTVLVPSKMVSGSSGPQSVERVPTNWAVRRTPNSHKPSEQVIGAIAKAVYNDEPIVGQFPVKFETDQWRMGPAFHNNGNGNDTRYGNIIRAQGPCVSY